MYKKQGYTLIELLIVVAIIAILAAIAVPNFLEAQVRSKIARVKADQRTIATAVESYMIDNNKPPIGENCTSWYGSALPSGIDSTNVAGWRWSFLTSPVSYMTSVPEDPFSNTGRLSSKAGGPVSTQLERRYIYIAAYEQQVDGTQPAAMIGANGSTTRLKNAAISWALYSWGPSRRQRPQDGKGSDALGALAKIPSTTQQLMYPDMFYDPSNGTTSYGYIFRTNKGIEPAG